MKQFREKETKYYGTFRELLEDMEKRYGARTAVTTYDRAGNTQEKNYQELKEDAFLCGASFCASGLSGKNIAIVSENSYEWLAAWFGIVSCGATAVCIDIEHPDDTIREMLEHAEVSAVVCSPTMKEICGRKKTGVPFDGRMIVIGEEETGSDSFGNFLNEGRREAEKRAFDEITLSPGQCAAIVYTSGTTSAAKPVMLSHEALLTNAADSLTLLDSRDKVFNSLPLYHTYGLTCGMFCGLMRGLNICICCDMKRMVRDMTLFKPGMLVAVPLIIEALYKMMWSWIDKAGSEKEIRGKIRTENFLKRPGMLVKRYRKDFFQSTCLENLDMILTGGACLDTLISTELAHFGIAVLQGYGITECSPSISCTRNEDIEHGFVGVILPHNEVKIAEDGEILVRGKGMMSGYYNEPELTAEAYDGEWFKTGDIGYMDRRGHLYITGRKKNLIVMKNGKKVAAEEMENLLRRMPLIKDVMVYGALSGVSADDVKIAASIYPDPELAAGMSSYEVLEKLQEFIDEANKKLPIYKQIRMINIRETDFGRTASHKIKRQIV